MIKVTVYHSSYGCDTGCCGHILLVEDGDKEICKEFDFSHPYNEDHVEFAKSLVRERAPECFDSIDWTTVNVESVSED